MAKENDKFKPLTMTQEEWDAIPPHVPKPPFEDPNEPDDFAEIFVANLNANALDSSEEQ